VAGISQLLVRNVGYWGGTAVEKCFAYGWHVRQRLRALRRGHRQRAHLAAFDVRDRFGQGAEIDLHLSAHQVGKRGRAAAIGHMQHVDAGHHFEEFARDMRQGSGAGRCHRYLAWVVLGISNELRKCFGLRRATPSPASTT
jgi:hypothetical protein